MNDSEQIDTLRADIGSRLRSERKRLGQTQEMFAQWLGMTRVHLINCEKGEASFRGEHLARGITHGLDVLFVLSGRSGCEDTPCSSLVIDDDKNCVSDVESEPLPQPVPTRTQAHLSQLSSLEIVDELLKKPFSGIRSGKDVQDMFYHAGASVAEWARVHGFNYAAVRTQIATSGMRASRGEAHKLAVLFGFKNGIVVEEDPHRRAYIASIIGADRVQATSVF